MRDVSVSMVIMEKPVNTETLAFSPNVILMHFVLNLKIVIRFAQRLIVTKPRIYSQIHRAIMVCVLIIALLKLMGFASIMESVYAESSGLVTTVQFP